MTVYDIIKKIYCNDIFQMITCVTDTQLTIGIPEQ